MNSNHSKGASLEDRMLVRLDNAPAGLTRTELSKNLGSSKKVSKALDTLRFAGKITCEIKHTGRKGRPTEKWKIVGGRFRP